MTEERWMIPLSQIEFPVDSEGNLLNPRGPVRDTSDLKLTMPSEGQKEAIEVYSEGAFWMVLDGHRRVTAARALGWTEIWAVEKPHPKNDLDAIAEMMVRNVRRNFDPVDLGRSCVRLHTANPKRYPLERLAAMNGVRVVDVQNMISLVTEAPEAVVKSVHEGRMSLTAYGELKNKPEGFQEAMASKPRATVAEVRRAMRQARKEAGEPTQENFSGELLAEGQNPALAALNAARAALMSATFDVGERAQAEQLVTDMAEFLGMVSDEEQAEEWAEEEDGDDEE